MAIVIDELNTRIEKLRLEPGDIAVLSTDLELSMKQIIEIRKIFETQIPPGTKTIILAWGLKLSVLTPAQIEQMAQ